MRTCSVDGCEAPHLAKGLCSRHYQRKKATGSPTGSLYKTLEERFWPKVDRSGECWEWTASRSVDGYGMIRKERERASAYAHRVSYELTRGPIPEGFQVDHVCHNTSCVNPDHLRLATQKQNSEHRAGADPSNRTGVRGVSWCKVTKKWRAKVCHFGETHYLGYFSTIEEADAAATAKRNELFTHNDKDRKAA